MFHGFLNLSKPAGMTSHDCIGRTRRLLKMKKVGHGGTLDPAATGVLPIALGHGTRFLNYLPTDKAYRATIRFGVVTQTDDLAGEVLATQSAEQLQLADIESYLPEFHGSIQQVPPNFSAIQIDGKRQYKLARQGLAVEIPARPVRIDKITVLGWQGGGTEHPELEVAIACGPGTYIRSIARDLGQKLGVGATLAHLVRTQSCGFELEDALTFEALEQQLETQSFVAIAFNQALKHLRHIELDDAYTKRWYFGQRLPLEWQEISGKTLCENVNPTPIFVQSDQGQILGIGLWQEGVLSPKVVLPNPSTP